MLGRTLSGNGHSREAPGLAGKIPLPPAASTHPALTILCAAPDAARVPHSGRARGHDSS
jgi:hypothetical protein